MVSEANQLMGSSDMRVPQVRVLLKASLGAWVLARPPDAFHLYVLWLGPLERSVQRYLLSTSFTRRAKECRAR